MEASPEKYGMTGVRYKIAGKAAREAIAALMSTAPWYAKPQLEALLDSDRGVEIRVDKIKRTHTSPQSGYYWLCLNIFAKAQGMTPDEAHGVILCEATGTRETVIGKRTYLTPVARSSNMNIDEYSNLIETLMRVAAFCGVVLPDPEQVVA